MHVHKTTLWRSHSPIHEWKKKVCAWKPLWIRYNPCNAMCTFPYLCNTFKLFLFLSDCVLFPKKTSLMHDQSVLRIFEKIYILLLQSTSTLFFHFMKFFFSQFFEYSSKILWISEIMAYLKMIFHFLRIMHGINWCVVSQLEL